MRSPGAPKQNKRWHVLGSSPPGTCCRRRSWNAPKPSSRPPRRPTMPRSPPPGISWQRSAPAGGTQGRQPGASGHRHPRTLRGGGRRTARLAGQFVRVQTPVMRIVRLHPLRLTAQIPSGSRRPFASVKPSASASMPTPTGRSRGGSLASARTSICDRARSPSRPQCPTRRRPEAGHVCARPARDRPGRQDRRRAGHRSSNPLRPYRRVRRP